jgi:cysteine desulfurase
MSRSKPIYLDYNATTPVDPAVAAAMAPYYAEKFGNAASTSHSFGWEAHLGVSKARKQVAHLIGAFPKDIYFTSGATESNNLILQGVAYKYLLKQQPCHVITSAVEHKCVLDTCLALQKRGVELTILATDQYGQVQPDDVRKALKPHTRLVSLIAANNEIGTVNPLAQIGRMLREVEVLFHTDAAQAVGKVPLSVTELDVDFLSGSGQKMYGPKGVGFFFRRRDNPRTELEPILFGGQQEGGLRPGTLNVPGIVGLGASAQIFSEVLPAELEKTRTLQRRLLDGLKPLAERVKLNGHPTDRIPTNLSLTFPALNSDILSMGLGEIAVSAGSACSLGEPSHVLKALGLSPADARKTLRIGLGRFTTESDIDTAVRVLLEVASG